jgi:NitT/TauT family transport system ATP-binding protein
MNIFARPSRGTEEQASRNASAPADASGSSVSADSDFVLSVENVDYSYTPTAPALRDLSLDLRRGEVLSIIGPSGCGKSTLLAAIAGLVAPNAGRVWWPGAAQREFSARSGPRLTIMFQKETLLPWLNVEQNVGVGLKYVKSMDRREKKERVDRLLEMGGLTDARHVYPRQLSGGMKRRAALLASVAPLPQVLMLDEPFAALDEPTRVGIHKEVLDICHEMEVSVILVTHDLAEAISLGDRVCILSARPATVVSTHEVPFAGDRDMFSLRQTDAFQALYKVLWGELSRQIEKA